MGASRGQKAAISVWVFAAMYTKKKQLPATQTLGRADKSDLVKLEELECKVNPPRVKHPYVKKLQ